MTKPLVALAVLTLAGCASPPDPIPLSAAAPESEVAGPCGPPAEVQDLFAINEDYERGDFGLMEPAGEPQAEFAQAETVECSPGRSRP